MPRQVTFDALDMLYGVIRVNGQDVSLDIAYQVRSTTGGIALEKRRDVSTMLTDAERQTILGLAARLKRALEDEELT
ncbi:MAG: hypothetical protein ACK4K2_07835 [Dehalococcoidia bacterium]